MKKEEEKCCGNCCWFCCETTDGDGCCFIDYPEITRCDEPANECYAFVSREEMRHHMAVLLQHNRWRRSELPPGQNRRVDPFEVGDAIDFAVKYMKVFSKL